MSTLSLAPRRSVLADRVLPKSLGVDALLVLGGAALTALLAQVEIPLWPVPITGQTLGVVLTAAALGPVRGTLVQVFYILAGAVGLPFYSEASHGVEVVMGATGGYLIGFIPAAYLIGLAAKRGADRNFLKALPLFAAGQAVIFAVGVPWLAVTTGMNASQALAAGFYPFILGGIVKAVIAAAVLGGAWFAVRRNRAA
jgi:biotin transport system substrate-specific component